MNNYKLSIIFILSLLIFSCKKEDEKILISDASIIPVPKSITNYNSGTFVFNAPVSFTYDKELSLAAELFQTYLENSSSTPLLTNNKEAQKAIVFKLDDSIKAVEGYRLNIIQNKIILKVKTLQGAFLGVQTLRQLLPPCLENNSCGEITIGINSIDIQDEPAFKYRGMHLDVGRHFFSVDFIKKYIDLLAMMKMNTFHWHLTEDQGWRIEIKKYPKLTSHAAYRKETLIGHYNDQPHQFDGKQYGGFYTQEEIKDIVQYATGRGITVIPEIELPGHSQAAISAYPELGCTGENVAVATKWGVFKEIYCPKESTFKFLENVLDEIIELFPSKYIHIGGDEAPKANWKNCDHCQQLIKSEGLKDEHKLQSYFITRIEQYLNSKGRQIIGWDEILEGGLAPNATVMSWRGTSGAVEAAKQHHDVILTPGSHCYFDHYQSDNENEPLAIGGFLPLEKVYQFNPIPEELSKEEAQYVLGAQGNVWTEYMKTSDHVEYMIFPRIAALSEVVWSPNKDYPDFLKRLEHFNKRLDLLDVNYANHIYDIKGKLSLSDNLTSYSLATAIEDKNIHYTTDDSEPTFTSPIYQKPINITQNTTIKARVFNHEKALGNPFEETINIHKATGATIEWNVQPHKAYDAGGKIALVNGIDGSNKRFGDKEWLGFWGDDLSITIDLGKEKTIDRIATRFFNAKGQWIYAPKSYSIEYSNDGEKFTKILSSDIAPNEDLIVNINTSFKAIQTQYLRINVTKYGLIPDGLQGAGHQAWTFIDEIKVW